MSSAVPRMSVEVEYLTPEQLASAVNVSIKTTYRWAHCLGTEGDFLIARNRSFCSSICRMSTRCDAPPERRPLRPLVELESRC